MYVRNRCQSSEQTAIEQVAVSDTPAEESHAEPCESTEKEPKPKKPRFKARRTFITESENPPESKINELTQNPSNEQSVCFEQFPEKRNPIASLYSGDELFVLALAVLILLEGGDDILILALGFILCP